jgi:hypothetical protein
MPHLGDEGISREDRGCEATRDGFEGVGVRSAIGLENCVGGVTIGAETVEDWAF